MAPGTWASGQECALDIAIVARPRRLHLVAEASESRGMLPEESGHGLGSNRAYPIMYHTLNISRLLVTKEEPITLKHFGARGLGFRGEEQDP